MRRSCRNELIVASPLPRPLSLYLSLSLSLSLSTLGASLSLCDVDAQGREDIYVPRQEQRQKRPRVCFIAGAKVNADARARD